MVWLRFGPDGQDYEVFGTEDDSDFRPKRSEDMARLVLSDEREKIAAALARAGKAVTGENVLGLYRAKLKADQDRRSGE